MQSKLNRDEILHIFITYGEQYAIPSQLIVNLVHGIKKLHPSPIIQVDADVASPLLLSVRRPCSFSQKAPGISAQGACEEAGLGTVILRHWQSGASVSDRANSRFYVDLPHFMDLETSGLMLGV